MINSSRALLVLLVATGVASTIYWTGQNTRFSIYDKVQTQKAININQPPIKSSVSALGTLEPVGEVHILAGPVTQIGGAPRIKSISVKEGEKVKQNQVLVTFDNSPQITAERARINANIVSKKAEIAILQSQTKRFELLTKTGSFPIAELEEKRARLAGFESQLQELLGALQTSDERLLSDTVIRAPISGVVLKINSRVGERAQESGVIEIGDTTYMQAVIQVDESDISVIRIGQPVIVRSENGAFSESLRGSVRSIGLKVAAKQKLGTDPALASDADQRVIDVKVRLDRESSYKTRQLTGVKVLAIITVP